MVLQYLLHCRAINNYFCCLPPWKDSSPGSGSSRSSTICSCIVIDSSLSHPSWFRGNCCEWKLNSSSTNSRHTNRESAWHLNFELPHCDSQLLFVDDLWLYHHRPHGVSTELFCYPHHYVHHVQGVSMAICEPELRGYRCLTQIFCN